MLMSKKNVIVYTIQMDTEFFNEHIFNTIDLIDAFKHEFESNGMEKEAKLMDNGGFSYRQTECNSYFTEYEISIITRVKLL